MQFCEDLSGCSRNTDKKCDLCKLRICFQHGAELHLVFRASKKHPHPQLNIQNSVMVLCDKSFSLSLGQGNATFRNFYEKVLAGIVLPGPLFGYFCKRCAQKYKAYYLEQMNTLFFPILQLAKKDGFICEAEEFCFLDVCRQAHCYLCAKRICHLHGRSCSKCRKIVCTSEGCIEKHRLGHPMIGNTQLSGL